MKTRQARFAVRALSTGLLLASQWFSNAPAQVLFLDNFEQFGNGTDLSSTNYTPASGPASASVATLIENGSATITATNFLGSTRALFDNSAVTNKNRYKGILSSAQTNQLLRMTWRLWIQATNSGPGLFMFSVPTSDPVANFNPPIVFTDTGSILALTNGTSPQTLIGIWGKLAGTVMTNTLIVDYPNRTFSYALNGQTLANLPLGFYFTNVVGAVYFTAFERSAGSLGNRFAIDDVKVEIIAGPLMILSGNDNFGVKSNRFGFDISGTTGKTVVVEACTDLAAPFWQPLQTNTSTTDVFYFSDPTWANYQSRSYRARYQ